MSEKSPGISRRHFWGLLGLASSLVGYRLGSVLSQSEIPFAGNEELKLRQGESCIDVRVEIEDALGNDRSSEVLLDDPEAKMRFEAGLNSSEEFSLLAEYLDSDTMEEGVLRLLYPAGGSHVASLYIAVEAINDGKVTRAELIYTEVDECKRLELVQNLSYLSKKDPDFTFDPSEVTFTVGGSNCDEIEYRFVVAYKGRPIIIHFCLNCSGEDYYRQMDFDRSDVYILHDALGHDPGDILHLISEYFRFQNSSPTIASPAIVIEDITAYNLTLEGKVVSNSRRSFDLELLGRMDRGQMTYGHRTHHSIEVDEFSDFHACKTLNDLKAYDDFAEETIERWKRESESAPKYYMKVHAETGQPYYNNGVFLRPYPQILELDPRLTTLLIDIGLAANNSPVHFRGQIQSNYDRRRVNDAFYEGGEAPALFGPSFLDDLFNVGHKIMDVIEAIDFRLCEGLAIRILQILIKIKLDLIPTYVYGKNHIEDSEDCFQRILDFIDTIYSRLTVSTKERIKDAFLLIRTYIEKQKDNYSFWRDEIYPLSEGVFDLSADELEVRRKLYGRLNAKWQSNLGMQENERMKIFQELYDDGNRLFDGISVKKPSSRF